MTESDNTQERTDLAQYWVDVNNQLEDLDDTDIGELSDLIDEFTDVLARERFHGGQADSALAESLAGKFASQTTYTKESIVKIVADNVEQLETNESADDETDDDEGRKEAITTLLTSGLDELVVYDPSDASASIRFSWRFENGVEVETTDEHLIPDEMIQAYHDSSSGRKNASQPDMEKDWGDWIRDLITRLQESGDRVRVVPVEGARTQAVEDLLESVTSKPATHDLGDAAQQHRAYIDPDDPEVVQIPNAVVDRVVSSFDEVNFRDLQVELDKREIREGNVRQTQVAEGVNVRFWMVDSSWTSSLDLPEESPLGGDDE